VKHSKVVYLAVEDVLEVHVAVLLPGEDPEVLKPLELDAATLAVQATFGGTPLLTSLAEVAAAYIYYLNMSHVFMDANKRTSLFSALLFLELNGFDLQEEQIPWLAIVSGVVSHNVSRGQLVDVFINVLGGPQEIE
jgi:death-on-curing protein